MMTRGSKTAADKVVREKSESGPDLGSPDRRESIPPVTDMQDSPLFKFLCELSPIQPAKSVHHAQTYNELTFPQEHRVFASPRSASRRCSTSALKRCVGAERVGAQGQAESGRESVGWQEGGTMSRSTVCGSPSPLNRRSSDRQVIPSSRRQGEEAGASQGGDMKMKVSGDDVYMGEQPGGEAMGAMSSGQLDPECTSREMDGIRGSGDTRFETEFADYSQLECGVSAAMVSEMVRCSDGEGARVGGARSEVIDGGERRLSTSSLVSHVVDCVVPGNLSQESRCTEGEEQKRLSMGCNSGMEADGLGFSHVAKGSPELDRETTAMAYFLAGNQEGGHGNEEWSENSSEVVVPRLPLRGAPGYCEQEKTGSIRREEGEMVDAITPQSGLGTGSEGHDPCTVITAQEVGQQQGLLSNRGDSSGQRGFRRRCLDFDASGARRKSLGSIGGRKAMGSRLKDCSGSSPGGDRNADCVVGDVIPATPESNSGRMQVRLSDLTNSTESERAGSDSGTHARGASRCGDGLAAMRRVQFTSGSYQKGEGGPQPQKAESQTPTSQKCGAAGAAVPAAGLRRSPRVRPSGIGLHLNSLTSAGPSKRECKQTGMESSKGVLATVLGLQPVVCASTKENPSGEGRGSAGYGGVVSQSFNPGVMSGVDGASIVKNRVSIPAPDFRCLNLESMSALEESLSLTPGANLPRVVSPRGQKRSQGHHEDLMRAAQAEGEAMDDILDSPQSLKRRRLSRRKSTGTAQSDKSGEGCKKCNCKKSKCLKLYCECFAAGVYCVGSCTCRDCFNKPEYEETVINTRHQIEIRNPQAFAPKIVQTAESSPAPGDEALDTPASARHKRGCNCKKSLCLKKYCECYQAGVGCSEGCRCEGCKNMYGRKEGPEGDNKEGEQANSIREESPAGDPIELLNRMSGKSDRLRDSAKSKLSPITPTFDNDGHGRPMLRLRSIGRKRGSVSDERCGSPLAAAASRPPTSPTRFSMDGFHLVPYPPQGDSDFSMSGAGDSPLTTPTFARMKHVSPQWEGLGDLCTLTPLPLPQPRPTPGSSCITVERPGTSPAFSSHMTESPYHAASSTSVHRRGAARHWSPRDDSSSRFRQPAPRSPLRFDTPLQSQVSDQCLSTPATPSMPPQSSLLISGRSLQSELESAKIAADDDGTPEFLKHGDESFGSPSRTTVTKSNSPKQKRVTPPRHAAYREPAASRGGGGNITQSSLARRFILQALPAPPSRAPSYPNG